VVLVGQKKALAMAVKNHLGRGVTPSCGVAKLISWPGATSVLAYFFLCAVWQSLCAAVAEVDARLAVLTNKAGGSIE